MYLRVDVSESLVELLFGGDTCIFHIFEVLAHVFHLRAEVVHVGVFPFLGLNHFY
jgi:hypothetical protein